MIGLFACWSSLVTKILLFAPLMPYGLLFIRQPYGLYAHHLHGQACGLKVCQLYDNPVILVLVNYPKKHSSSCHEGCPQVRFMPNPRSTRQNRVEEVQSCCQTAREPNQSGRILHRKVVSLVKTVHNGEI